MQQKNPCSYQLKLIKSGNMLEWYEYSIPIEYTSLDKTKNTNKHIDYTKKNLIKTKKKIVRLLTTNTQLNKFLTLTFERPLHNITYTNKLFKQFIQRLSYKYENLQYLAVPEPQKKRGIKYNIIPPIHYHVLNNLPYIKKQYIQKIWKNGIIDIRRIKHIKNIGLYISKYITKEDMYKQKHKKKFFYSKNLKQPTIMYDDFALNYILRINKKLDIEFKYNLNYVGECLYKRYFIKK